MRCAAALSTHPVAAHATGEVISDLLEHGTVEPDLVVIFTTPSFAGACEDMLGALRSTLGPTELLSITSSGVIGGGSEVREGSGLTAWALWSDDRRSHMRCSVLPLDQGVTALGPDERAGLITAESVILLADPSLSGVTRTLSDACSMIDTNAVVGALLSSARGTARITDAEGREHGAVAITLSARLEPIIGFGSSPISKMMLASRVHESMLCEIDRRPAIDVVHEILATVDAEDRTIVAKNLAVGIHHPLTGSLFDVLAVLGTDRDSGALALSDAIPEGSRFRFHRQDAGGSIEHADRALGGPRASGALLFSCTPLDQDSDRHGVGDLSGISEALGTSAFAGAHVSAVIGPGSRGVGLRGAPLSAAILGRSHH